MGFVVFACIAFSNLPKRPSSQVALLNQMFVSTCTVPVITLASGETAINKTDIVRPPRIYVPIGETDKKQVNSIILDLCVTHAMKKSKTE